MPVQRGASTLESSDYPSACSHGGMYSVDSRLVRLDFSSSLNPLGAPARAVSEMVKNAAGLAAGYPDPECTALKKSLCQYLGHGLQEEQLCIGNGALELIHWFAMTFASKQVVIPSPTFCEYELASRKAGAMIRLVGLANHRGLLELDSDSVVSAAQNASAIFLCNPNNPTGLLSTKEIEAVLGRIPSSTMVLVDECFIELSKRPEDSLVKRIGEFENLVIVRSLTKSFALAGLRVGYCISSEQVAAKLVRHKIHWNVNALAQAAGTAALEVAGRYLDRARALVAKERSFLSKIKTATPLYSDANYLLIRLDTNSTRFRDSLLKQSGILVRDCSTFAGMDDRHIRVGVKVRRQNAELVKALEKLGALA